MMQRIKEVCYRLPGIKGIMYRLMELEKKYEELSVRYEELKTKDRGLDFRIDDVYHQIFLNRKESLQYYYRLLPKEAYPQALEAWYFAETGKKLDLEHPVTFNEKLQWIKLYGLNPECTQLSDKYAVREYIEKMLGERYLVPLLGVWDTFAEIDFDKLPNRFVLKANHGSGMNVIVRDKSAFDRQAAEKLFQRWLDTDYAFYQGFELQYHGIARKIIAEAYMEDDAGDLKDYKVYCFHGNPEFIGHFSNRNSGGREAMYDLDWNPLPFTTGTFAKAVRIERPRQLDQVIEMSRILSRDFLFVRIDWYLPGDGSIRFGEMTFTAGSGIASWEPSNWDMVLGNKLKLPVDGYKG